MRDNSNSNKRSTSNTSASRSKSTRTKTRTSSSTRLLLRCLYRTLPILGLSILRVAKATLRARAMSVITTLRSTG